MFPTILLVMHDSNSLNVIVFADTILRPNGVRTYYRTLLDWSRKTDSMRVTVVFPAGPKSCDMSQPEGVISVRPVAQIPNPFYRELIIGHYKKSTLRTIIEAVPSPRIVHIATSGPLGVCGARVAKHMGIPMVGFYHVDTRRQCVEPYLRLNGKLGHAIANWVDRRAYAHCEAMCAPSETAAEAARSFCRREVSVISNPIDVDHFIPGKDRTGAFRNKYAGHGEVLAIVVGRVAKEKNLDLVCQHLLHDKRIKTVFVGDGPDAGHLRNKWQATVTGFLEGDDLLAAFQQSDLFIQLSVKETFGLSLAEAMSAGLPAVALRGRGFVKNIPPGHGVEVLSQDEVDTLADRCVAIVSDRPSFEKKSKLAREFALSLGPNIIFPKFEAFHRQFAI